MSPSYNHSYLSYRIARALDCEDKYNIHVELPLDIDGSDFVPDIALYDRKKVDFMHDKTKTDEPPKMVVEILSPKQSVNEITDKFETYLQSGIKSCWLVIPPTKTIVIFNDITRPHSYTEGKLVDSEMNISFTVDDIFK